MFLTRLFKKKLSLTSDLRALTAGNNAFALALYSVLKQEKGNLFFSPYSISSALAMTYGGARNDTAEEMAEAIHFNLGPDKLHPAFAELSTLYDKIQEKGEVRLHIANSLWPQKEYPFLPDYLELLKAHYELSITPVDYTQAAEEARRIINRWMKKKTRGRIKDLIGPGALNSSITLVLANAIYFKGNWAHQFSPRSTAKAWFRLADGSKTQVPLMHRKGYFGYKEIEGAQLLELPYVGNDLSMLVILPYRADTLQKLENRLSAENLEAWTARLRKKEIDVFLPKFKLDWGAFDLRVPLQALGMRKAFDTDGPDADFSGMDGTKSFVVGPLLHKAFIEVNEEGTEAAATTATGYAYCYGCPTFRADHPFLFLIRDKTTGSILFLGRLLDPGRQAS